ncbi:MAG: VanZ family protein [Oscillibacter sp.]|nr:VanZ family protein [Oscillibacter sp.]
MSIHRTPVRVWLFSAWMLMIFLHSLQPADLSGRESGWVLSLLLHLLPWLTDHMVRKAAHFTEFAILGVLSEPLGRGPSFSRRTAAWFSLSLCVAAALSDETIQLFVEGRAGQVSDVWLDISGAAFGLALAVLVRALWKRTGEKTG